MRKVLAPALAGVRVPFVLTVAALQLAAWAVGYNRLSIAFATPLQGLGEVTLSLLLTIVGLHLLGQLTPTRATGVAVKVAVASLYLVLTVTTLTLGQPPDYGIIAEHWRLLLYPSSFVVLISAMQVRVGIIAVSVLAVLLAAEFRFATLSKGWPRRTPYRAGLAAVGYLVLLAAAWTGPFRTHDAASRFLLSAVNYHVLPAGAGAWLSERPGSTLQPFVSTYSDARPTHVFFVMMESFNGLWLERTTAAGDQVTPVLNRVRREGISVEHFYANSIHTSRGFAASLCSVLPSLQMPVPQYPGLRLRCLPSALSDAGYATYFFHNSSTLERENMNGFLAGAGVQHAFSLDDGLVDQDRDADLLWGFGGTLQDDLFFERILSRLDADRDRGLFGSPATQPVFVGISTSSHHMWFDWVPERERRLYADPKSQEERFASSLHTSDRYIGSFLEALTRRPWADGALVVLVGDHGFPAGEHGNFVNAIGAREENFRTPLVLWSPGWLSARNIDDRAHSQVDLMPTLLDILGVDSWAHMAGESIVATRTEPAGPELLLQPYDGRQLVSLRYPYKLVRRFDTGQDSLFNLEEDPREARDLLRGSVHPRHRAMADELAPPLREFLDNQIRIRMNTFVPAR